LLLSVMEISRILPGTQTLATTQTSGLKIERLMEVNTPPANEGEASELLLLVSKLSESER